MGLLMLYPSIRQRKQGIQIVKFASFAIILTGEKARQW
jgi:hypothetical protein